MKYLLFFIMLLLSTQAYSQITGATQTGKLIFNNENSPTSPQIILLEPKLNDSNVFFTKDKSVKIKGILSDSYGIKELFLNDKPVNFSDNKFETSITLNGSSNWIQITAVNTKEKSSTINFSVTNNEDTHGPTLQIVEPLASRGIKVVKKSDVITIRGIASDISGVLEVTVNNQKAELADNGEFTIDLYLKMGDNKIAVKAIDNKLNTTIDTFTVTRQLKDIIKAGKFYALVIGINSYTGYWPKLKNAVNDAKGVAQVLKNYYLFDEVDLILDKDATRRNIIHQFENLAKNLNSEDNLLIFYAGHGQFNKELNKGYWVPSDATSNSVADYISNSDVKTFLGGIPSKHTLLITDACFAGDIFRGKPAESISFDPNNMERYYKEVYNKQSRSALTSGGVEEVSDAGKDNHSVFTYYLIKALKENNQKYLDAGQLFNDFRVAVANNSEQTPMLQVVRDTDDEGGQFVFIKKDK